MNSLELYSFANKRYGLLVIYTVFGFIFVGVCAHFILAISPEMVENSTIAFLDSLISETGIKFLCAFYCLGVYVILFSKEKKEDEYVARLRADVSLYFAKIIMYLLLFFIIFNHISQYTLGTSIYTYIVVFYFTNYLFKYYSSLKFSTIDTGIYSLLPENSSILAIFITVPSIVFWGMSNEYTYLKPYLAIPSFAILALLIYMYQRLSKYIFNW